MKGEMIAKTPEIKNALSGMMIAEMLEVGTIEEVLKEETSQRRIHITAIEQRSRE